MLKRFQQGLNAEEITLTGAVYEKRAVQASNIDEKVEFWEAEGTLNGKKDSNKVSIVDT